MVHQNQDDIGLEVSSDIEVIYNTSFHDMSWEEHKSCDDTKTSFDKSDEIIDRVIHDISPIIPVKRKANDIEYESPKKIKNDCTISYEDVESRPIESISRVKDNYDLNMASRIPKLTDFTISYANEDIHVPDDYTRLVDQNIHVLYDTFSNDRKHDVYDDYLNNMLKISERNENKNCDIKRSILETLLAWYLDLYIRTDSHIECIHTAMELIIKWLQYKNVKLEHIQKWAGVCYILAYKFHGK